MKDIKQYIGKKVAIECASSEEWDQISKLTGNTKKNYYNDSSSAKCFDLLYLGNYWSGDNKKEIEAKDYTIYPASDFIEFQFEVGKWYTSDKWNKTSYAKFENKYNDQFHYSEMINPLGEYIKCKFSWGIHGNFREVPIEEIQHLLTDKIITLDYYLEKTRILNLNLEELKARLFEHTPYEFYIQLEGIGVEEKAQILYNKWNMNTYGLKVGDFLPVQKIRDWSNIGENRSIYTKNNEMIWAKIETGFIGDRRIESFKFINGHIGFLVSDTVSVYLRAEGFKEFLEDSFVLPEKWCIKVTTDNKKVLGKWRKLGPCGKMSMDYCSTNGYIDYRDGYWSSYKPDYPEITFEQFKKYVLKENSLPNSQSDFKDMKEGDLVIIDHLSIMTPHVSNAIESLMKSSMVQQHANNLGNPILIVGDSDKELVIPKVNKVLSAIDYSVQTKLPELNISLPKNKAKEVKQIKIENFLITI